MPSSEFGYLQVPHIRVLDKLRLPQRDDLGLPVQVHRHFMGPRAPAWWCPGHEWRGPE